jgi:LmbE family N-acetylglucosaminyl deacetylase
MEPLEAALGRAASSLAATEIRWRLERGGKRILLLAPHPDDEAIGAGGSLVLEARAGADTLVLFLTDGARGASGRGGEGALRRLEAKASAEVLDLSGYLIAPWQSRDLRQDPGAAAERLAAMFAVLAPLEIWMPSPYEGHPTHLASTLAGLQAVARVPSLAARVRLLGYETWDPIPAGTGLSVRDISSVVDDKERAIRCHRSQCSVRAFDEAMLARNRSEALFAAHTGELAATHVEHFLDLAPIVTRSPVEIGTWLSERTRQRFESVRAELK